MVVVTGASRGLGAALAAAYAGDGRRVVGLVRTASAAPAPGVELVVGDVTDPAALRRLRDAVGSDGVGLLLNNAGISGPERQSSWDADLEGFAQVLAVNTVAPLAVVQALHGCLRQGSVVVNVSSRMGSMSYAKSGSLAYRASKAGLNKLTQCLATDLLAEGVVVVAVHPGWVRTDMGGPEADIDVATSVRGLRRVVAGLTAADAGSFLDHEGNAIPW